MKRFNNNNYNHASGKAAWVPGRQESYPVNHFGGRFPNGGRRDGGNFNKNVMDDGDMECRTTDESRQEEPVSSKLDRVLERLDKFDAWRDDTDRRFENLDPLMSRETEPPSGFDEGDEWEFEEGRRQRLGDRGMRGRNPNVGFHQGPPVERGRRENRGRNGPAWTTQNNRNPRHQFGGFDQSYDRPATCWDPPQRYQANNQGYDKQQRVKMEPPRFDGSDAANWISRVQYYFNHLMMPEAQRFAYCNPHIG